MNKNKNVNIWVMSPTTDYFRIGFTYAFTFDELRHIFILFGNIQDVSSQTNEYDETSYIVHMETWTPKGEEFRNTIITNGSYTFYWDYDINYFTCLPH